MDTGQSKPPEGAPPVQYDVRIYSDGSGAHSDAFGAGAAVVVSERFKLNERALWAGTGFNTYRAEVGGVLAGLRQLHDSLGGDATVLRGMGLSVLCHVDNEATSKAIRNKDARKSSSDLWRMFSFYEEIFRITAVCLPRNSTPEMFHADHLASTARPIIKEFFQNTKWPSPAQK